MASMSILVTPTSFSIWRTSELCRFGKLKYVQALIRGALRLYTCPHARGEEISRLHRVTYCSSALRYSNVNAKMNLGILMVYLGLPSHSFRQIFIEILTTPDLTYTQITIYPAFNSHLLQGRPLLVH